MRNETKPYRDMETIARDSRHQELMDHAYETWRDRTCSYSQFLDTLSHSCFCAVILGNFNGQMELGGFEAWESHGFSSRSMDLLSIVQDMALTYRDGASPSVYRTLSEALTTLRRVRSGGDRCDHHREVLKTLERSYLLVRDKFMAECETYLIRLDT